MPRESHLQALELFDQEQACAWTIHVNAEGQLTMIRDDDPDHSIWFTAEHTCALLDYLEARRSTILWYAQGESPRG